MECHHAGIVLPNNAGVESGGRNCRATTGAATFGAVPLVYICKVTLICEQNKIKAILFLKIVRACVKSYACIAVLRLFFIILAVVYDSYARH